MNRKMFVTQTCSSRMETLGWILFMWASLSEAFNIDTEHPLRFNGSAEDFFGYSVYQSEFENRKQIIVGAPLKRNSTGEIYSCTVDLLSCRPLHWPGSESVRFFGMSTAVSSAAVGRLTSCSPYLPHDCDGNSYLNGVCYQFNSGLQPVSNFTAAYQECTKREVNLVFLFDGSASMKDNDFEMNKKFIIDVMKKLSNSSIKFAAVQFSSAFRTVFDFNDYQNGSAEGKLMKEKHMKSLTNTRRAIKYALTNLLNNASSGADLSAQKALVIITDGDPTDPESENIILKTCDEQNILRYIIGVGKLDLTRLTQLASEPKTNNTFYIQDYNGLEGLLDNLQKKIYNIEGSKDAQSKDRPKELSQSGFSVLYHKDSVIVGSVGSNDWRGSLYEVTGSGSGFNETEIKDPAVSKDSYMGYSAVLGMRGGISLLFSGAPRAEHTGLVTLFTKNEGTWTVTRNITGEQVSEEKPHDIQILHWQEQGFSNPTIGSYFGASLSVLDLDSDGDSDFLLVGSPLFHQSQPRAEGRLYVYDLSKEYFLKTLNVSESNTGRFAASLASLKDLNGDSLSDVAVGAPLENDGEGVVYIYLGDRTCGINPKHAQRIPARSVLPGLKQFGVSLSGQMDMSDDNLTDVVIGAQGGIVLLKARPVMSVYAQLSFSPSEISLIDFECPSDKELNTFNLTSCLTVAERTSSSGSLKKNLNVSLNLNVDVMRGINRGFFVQSDSSSRTLQQFVLLDSGISCFSFPIFMKSCTADTVSPLKIRINFSQTEMFSESSKAILDIHSRTEEYVEVPFQRNCNSNSSCVSDLKMNFSFTNDTLLVVNQAHFTVLVSLANPGDDSFNTSIVLHYPEGLSLSKFDTVKPSRTRSSCGDRDSGAMNRTTCSINQPVYRSGTTTHFLAIFRVKRDYDWADRMEMMITANSDNNGNISDTVVRRSVPVQFAVDLAISLVAEDSVTYLNFSLEDRGPKPLNITYKVENLGFKGLPVSLKLILPCQTKHVTLTSQTFSMKNSSVPCEFTKPQDGHCGKFECGQFDLQKFSAVHFILTADAALQNVKEYESKYSFSEFRKYSGFDISAELHFNRSRYNQTSTGLKDDPHKSQTNVSAEFVVLPSKMLIVGTGAGGGVILLIFLLILLVKCGFFKRKRPDEFPSENENITSVEDSPLMNTNGKENGGVASLSEAFNIDTEHPLRFNGAAEDFFGYSVYQSEFENRKQIIVGAPFKRNSRGEIYSCTEDLLSCRPLHWPGSESVRFFGMSTAVSSAAVGRLTSCSPYLPRECDGNSYPNGICFQFNSDLQAVSNFTVAYQECTKREVNLVFLFDGSASMRDKEFEMNKKFIIDVMKKLSNSSIKFAAVQFSSAFRTVFDFNDYQDGSAEEKLMKEKHMKSLTNTRRAIKYVLTNLLNNASSGADLSAQKALVIITDGDPTDPESENIILKRCDEQNILRYIIGVGKLDLTRLTQLASEPKTKNTFYIQDYSGLEGLLDNLQKKIEESKDAQSKDRLKELSQSGFSVLYHKDSVIVGSAGSNDWRGSLYEVTGSGSGFKETEIKNPDVSKDSYMGYSAVLGKRGGVSLLFSGAPRAEHTGLVTLFTKNEGTWTVTGNITGEQFGSYFGASLSVLDLDSDGDSDFLLVGSPLFHQSQPRAEGRLYVYDLSEEYFQKTLNVSESNTGRFAASLASLKDLNGDSLSDVAVGAPLENDGEGVVYIYLGDRTHGINPEHAQRIPARSVLPGLQQFGVSLSGQMDMTEDNLTDVVIGAQGGIVLLKARPVMSVSAQLSFSPSEISLTDFECPSDKELNAFNLTSCLTVAERTSSSGSLKKNLNVSLNLNVDVMRGINRGFFVQSDSSSRALQQFVLLDSGISCFSFPIFMKRCTADTVSPLKIRMNFSQTEMFSESSKAIHDIHSRTEEYVEVPFQRNCNSNSSCVSDLKMNFSFTNDTLLVVNQAHFTVLVLLANPGDDSFNTSIVLHYPEGLSLSKFDTVKPSWTRSSCGDRDSGALNRTTCSINQPVYRSGTTTHFLAIFRVKRGYDWADRMEMMITAYSDNNGNISDTVVRRSVPVQFAVDLAISLVAEDSVTYLNFSLEDRGPKPLNITYKVRESNTHLQLHCVVDFMCQHETNVSAEFVVPPSKMLIVGTGAGGGVILLIIILILLVKLNGSVLCVVNNT
ncbi:Integrin alpha-M [Anabarilius grahami]|uniref:Integrin alpha-M n=1 Tax=Anabarilius grahami TaxID=495550 RepID=A0A3N0XWC0_ANAGA|nr:Integrin alpha-M [Anabarilius grahami]